MSNTSYPCQRLMKLGFSQQLYDKSSCKRDQWDPCYCLRLDRRTDGQRDATKILVAVRNFANDPKNDKL